MTRIIIIGASHAGITLADLLRKNGCKDEIVIFDKLTTIPFEKPPLSKSFISDNNNYQIKFNLIRQLDWYKKNNIILKLGISVNKISENPRRILLNDGSEVKFSKLILATGAKPKLLPKEICETENALVLRTFEDAGKIVKNVVTGNSIVIIGGGYIGLELAASLIKIGCKVKIIEMSDRLLSRVASKEISDYFYKLHTNNKVSINLNCQINSIKKTFGKFKSVLKNGNEIFSDKILLGIGVDPEMSLAESSSIVCEDGIIVDSNCRTSKKDIYAIGDCCIIKEENPIRIESIHNAQYTASKACSSILGLDLPKYEPPWFWSDQFDIKFQSVGLLPKKCTTIFRKGNKEGSKSFWSFEGNDFRCIETINDPQAFMVAKHILQKKITKFSKNNIRDPEFNLKSILKN